MCTYKKNMKICENCVMFEDEDYQCDAKNPSENFIGYCDNFSRCFTCEECEYYMDGYCISCGTITPVSDDCLDSESCDYFKHIDELSTCRDCVFCRQDSCFRNTKDIKHIFETSSKGCCYFYNKRKFHIECDTYNYYDLNKMIYDMIHTVCYGCKDKKFKKKLTNKLYEMKHYLDEWLSDDY